MDDKKMPTGVEHDLRTIVPTLDQLVELDLAAGEFGPSKAIILTRETFESIQAALRELFELRRTAAFERYANPTLRAKRLAELAEHEARADMDDPLPAECPDCGKRTSSGYGVAGGGMGAYVMCECGFMSKVEDPGV